MVIKFIVEIEGEDFPFTVNTDKLPCSMGNKYLRLKGFEICEDELGIELVEKYET